MKPSPMLTKAKHRSIRSEWFIQEIGSLVKTPWNQSIYIFQRQGLM